MKDLDFIIKLYRYFSQFVPKPVLKKMFVQQRGTRRSGYEELETEILSAGDEQRIDDIEKFVLSINEKYVSDRIKNTSGIILFVEYGQFTVDRNVELGVKEQLAVTVVHDFSFVNNDNINEVLIMNHCLQVLNTIISRMQEEQSELNFCVNEKLIDSPVEYNVVDPVTFYGFGGWSAIFNNANTILI